MIEALIAAYKECTEQRDIKPDKVLRPVGTVFKSWCDDPCSTDLPHWVWWRVKGYMESFRQRHDYVLFYERMEEIEGIDEPEHD